MKLDIFLIIIISLFTNKVISQTSEQKVFASAGLSTNQISYTIGEPLTLTLVSTNTNITQGFHQTNLSIVGIEESENSIFINVYPNPTQNDFTVLYDNLENSLEMQLLDVQGKEYLRQMVINGEQTSVINLAQGNYLIIFRDKSNKVLAKYQLIKR